MSRWRGERGYAMLAALVIMALAAVFATTSVAAVLARQSILSADAASARARTLERRALAAACLEARRGGWSSGAGSVAGADGSGASWRADWSPLPGHSASGWPEFAVGARSVCGRARRSEDAVVQLRRVPFTLGPVVLGDAQLDAPLAVGGAGLYSGGCVRGREWVTFPSPHAGPAADGVHGDLWPLAGVHALGGIWVRGEEEHSGPSSPPAADTDTHSAVNDVMDAVLAPSRAWLDTAHDWADPSGAALQDGVLRLDRLPAAPSSAGARASGSGLIIWLAQSDSPVRVIGDRPSDWCPVVVVSPADLSIGGPSVLTRFTGAVVCTGRLDVQGEVAIEGGLCAGTLHVGHPLDVEMGASWRSRGIPGLILPVIVGLDSVLPAGN